MSIKGHAMTVLKKGLISGNELVEEFSSQNSNTEVFFLFDPTPGWV